MMRCPALDNVWRAIVVGAAFQWWRVEGCVKRVALGTLVALVAASAASAADLRREPYVAAPYSAFSWAGYYLGANLGYQWATFSNSNVDPKGILGGVQTGYNWQTGQFVYGVEADWQASGANDTFAAFKFSNPWFGTVRGRFGYAMDNVLFYGTGGLAYGSTRVALLGSSESRTSAGWTVGAGAEVGLTDHWSVKAEYLFFDLGEERYGLTGLNHDLRSNLFRLGVNFRF